jgi:hypothetical protein
MWVLTNTFVIETWGKRIERLCAHRGFTVGLASGEKVASAASLWMILDKRWTPKPRQRPGDLLID